MAKRFNEVSKLVDINKLYSVNEAAALIKQTAKAKFDESVEVHVRLGIDPKKSDQSVRGTVSLPNGIGKTRKVVVIAKGEKQNEAKNAGADAFGSNDIIDEIAKGWLDFDILVATPDTMKDLSKVAKILGPKGLMPNPKSGTVTFDIEQTVKDLKKGRVEYKNDAYGIIHCAVGKASFEAEKIAENIKTLLEAVQKAKPSVSKGQYIKSISVSSTMGPGIYIDHNQKF
ncbi:MAG: 50S ribosomal protein L1 [Endomicrobiaceae bacterium]|jgi:large subunit ribosomal protein L1|nr:50S ribosomal protein L1 [Endomicrobiaceae bacterium]MDD3730273.1 50S ribosomal protein L1 [Endomicrobiaceae bacterium]MDD4165513.1 50S ribosomal protein L1 [Endomicrobiaceae bacterium]